MSTPPPTTGRVNQKNRTRNALIAAARELVADGETPTVEQTATRAEVSRTTAYRYFPTQGDLLVAAHPEIGAESLLPDPAPSAVEERLSAVIAAFLEIVAATEVQQRSMLRLSLDLAVDEDRRRQLPLRQGRAIGWIEEALAPLSGRLTADQVHQLALAIRSVAGIEALVWLTDVGGLSTQAADAVMAWSSRALLSAALKDPPPVSG